jgi:hypothetical protein
LPYRAIEVKLLGKFVSNSGRLTSNVTHAVPRDVSFSRGTYFAIWRLQLEATSLVDIYFGGTGSRNLQQSKEFDNSI